MKFPPKKPTKNDKIISADWDFLFSGFLGTQTARKTQNVRTCRDMGLVRDGGQSLLQRLDVLARKSYNV